MKRAGEHEPATRPSAKQQKTVTFLLPAKRPRSPTSGGATAAPSRTTRRRGDDGGRSGGEGAGSMPPPPPQQPGGRGGALDRQASSNYSGMSSSQHSAGSSAGSLGHERGGYKAPSRFSFDFMDDSLSSRSTSRGDASLSHGHGSVQSTSPRAGSGGRWSRPSPNRSDRLDARYSSRLPPSYARSRSDASPGSQASQTSSTARAGSAPGGVMGDMKRNLFGESGADVNLLNNGMNAMAVGAAAFDDGGDTTIVLPPPMPVTPGRAADRFRARAAERLRVGAPGGGSDAMSSGSGASSSSPRHYSNYRHLDSPAKSAASAYTSQTSSSTVSTRTASTFMSSSPRRRGMVTGVTSPMSGDLGHVATAGIANGNGGYPNPLSPCESVGGGSYAGSYAGSACSSPASSLAGAGDRYIPSRALSNFNFELAAGTGGRVYTVLTSAANGANGGGGAGDGGAGASAPGGTPAPSAREVEITPSPSFGATMMGGGSITVDDGPDALPAPSPSVDDDDAPDGSERHDASNRQPLLYDALLRSELLGENIDPAAHSVQSPTGLVNTRNAGATSQAPFRERSNHLRFSPRQLHRQSVYQYHNQDFGSARHADGSVVQNFDLAPVSMNPNARSALGGYTERCKRKIARVPTKVLDAPALQDDFYLNLVDWSSQNVLAVGLGSCVYLWSAATAKVVQLTDLAATEDNVTSVAWSEGGKHLAIGSTRGEVQLWDTVAQKLVRTMDGHSARVGALSWKLSGGGSYGGQSLLASGSRDRLIYLRDPRSEGSYEMKLTTHKQEVCGLRWSFDERGMLASGGNDNKLLVWDVKRHGQHANNRPLHTFSDHTAAVKAIAWSPHQHGLLASGGGTADRCIRFWNCLTGHGINCIDTGSQVCNLAFSRNCNELVSTHGYSLNQIVVWRYPSMQKIATLTGHTYRVLYLALSPDGSTIVTGAGDETLRFWQVFPGPQKENKAGGLLFPVGMPGSVLR